MEKIGRMWLEGNISCFKYGYGETCQYSLFRAKYGQEATITKDIFYDFENDKKAIEGATALGRTIANALQQ